MNSRLRTCILLFLGVAVGWHSRRPPRPANTLPSARGYRSYGYRPQYYGGYPAYGYGGYGYCTARRLLRRLSGLRIRRIQLLTPRYYGGYPAYGYGDPYMASGRLKPTCHRTPANSSPASTRGLPARRNRVKPNWTVP